MTITGTGFSTASGATTVDFGSTGTATGVSCSEHDLLQRHVAGGIRDVSVTATVGGPDLGHLP